MRFASVKSDGYDNSNSDSNYESDTSTEHARVKSTKSFHNSKHSKQENDSSSGKLDSALRRELKRLGAIGPSAKPLKLSRAFQVRVYAHACDSVVGFTNKHIYAKYLHVEYVSRFNSI